MARLGLVMRDELSRLAAPAAALAAVTIALLVLRAQLGSDEQQATRAALTPPVATTTAGPTRKPTRTQASTLNQQFHEIEAGDTLGAVADRYETTLEALLGLNPGVDPAALQVGQRIRVK